MLSERTLPHIHTVLAGEIRFAFRAAQRTLSACSWRSARTWGEARDSRDRSSRSGRARRKTSERRKKAAEQPESSGCGPGHAPRAAARRPGPRETNETMKLNELKNEEFTQFTATSTLLPPEPPEAVRRPAVGRPPFRGLQRALAEHLQTASQSLSRFVTLKWAR